MIGREVPQFYYLLVIICYLLFAICYLLFAIDFPRDFPLVICHLSFAIEA